MVYVYRDEFGIVTIHREGCGHLGRIQTAYSADGRKLTSFTNLELAGKKYPEASPCGCTSGRKAAGIA
jgi:hypothetical protein